MMNIKNLLVGFGFVTAVSSLAFAESKGGLFVEPTITYEKGETDVNYPSPLNNSTGTSDGFGIGARLGFHLSEAFFLGADARYSMPQFKDSSVNYDSEAVSTNYGPVIGFQMPNMGLRLWGTYILGGELDPKEDGNFDVKFENAKGYRIGAGFRVQSFSLNVEYQELDYDNAKLEKFGPFGSGNAFDSVGLNNKSWIVSASFPMEF